MVRDPGEKLAQRRKFGRRRAGKGRGVGGDAMKRAQEHGEADGLAVALPLGLDFGRVPFGPVMIWGFTFEGRLDPLTGGFGQDRRFAPSRLAAQSELERDAEAHRGEAAIEEVVELDLPRDRLGLLGLGRERLAEAVGALGEVIEPLAGQLHVHENKYGTCVRLVKSTTVPLVTHLSRR
ncbi:MAG: hypothetical protein KIS90_03275 [Phenylobacterium sp.]|nr:hypothetical protein [Phenylobacterium sp.]